MAFALVGGATGGALLWSKTCFGGNHDLRMLRHLQHNFRNELVFAFLVLISLLCRVFC